MNSHKLSRWIRTGTCVATLCCAVVPSHTAAAAEPSATVSDITISVGTQPRQAFAGFGASIFPWTPSARYNAQVTPKQTAEMADSIWRDSRFRSVRLWIHPGAEPVSYYVDGFFKTGKLQAVIAAGAKDLILAPEYLPADMNDGKGYIKATDIPRYAAVLADFILDFKRQTGILINHSGILNEPNDRPVKFSDVQWPVMIKAFRQALDTRGLKTVQIIAPESANCSEDAYRVVDSVRSDTAAWRALAGVATHSYNNAATEEMAGRALGQKPYWMTEASDVGPEVPGDALRAASVASRFLNDMNHGVTHWMHFIGFEEADPKDNATRILAYDVSPFRITRFQKYSYYNQLAHTFDVGAVLRHSTSDKEGEMTYTYGKKPRINAAVAKNPDGTWAIGLSNYTAPSFRDEEDPKNFVLHNSGYSAKTFRVTVRIPELAKRQIVRFAVRRSNSNVNNAALQTLVMRNGVVVVPDVQPLDLITLRSLDK